MERAATVKLTVTLPNGQEWISSNALSEEELKALQHDMVSAPDREQNVADVLSGYLDNMIESSVDLYHEHLRGEPVTQDFHTRS